MDLVQSVGMAAVFVLAGAVKGVTGMGLPTVAVSLLGLWMPPAQAAALLVAPSLATNIAQCRGPHGRALLARLWPAWLMLALATVAMPAWDAPSMALGTRRLLGVVLVAYGAWGLWAPRLPDWSGRSAWRGAAAGAVTGIVTSLSAVFVMPLVPYLQTLRLEKDAMVQALGLSFTVATLALAVRLQVAAPVALWSGPSLLALGAAFAGLALGMRLRSRLSGPAFRSALFAVFIGLGAANLLRGAT